MIRADVWGRLAEIARDVLAAIPGATFAEDQPFRLTSIAFARPEDADARAAIASAMRAAGADVTDNNLWVLGWLGGYDKLAMTRRVLATSYGVDIEAERDAVLYVGDSINDAPMFGFFRHTVGVSTVTRDLPQIPTPPTWISEGPGGDGFVEAADAVLMARNCKAPAGKLLAPLGRSGPRTRNCDPLQPRLPAGPTTGYADSRHSHVDAMARAIEHAPQPASQKSPRLARSEQGLPPHEKGGCPRYACSLTASRSIAETIEESRAAARRIADRYLASMQFHHFLGDREAQARADAFFALTPEWFEYFLAICGLYAVAVIDYLDARIIADPDDDRSALRLGANGVVHEIRYYRFERASITAREWPPVVRFKLNMFSAADHETRPRCDHVPDDVDDVYRFVYRRLTFSQSGRDERLLDDRLEVAGVLLEIAVEGGLPRILQSRSEQGDGRA